jgi:hypothetical protein
VKLIGLLNPILGSSMESTRRSGSLKVVDEFLASLGKLEQGGNLGGGLHSNLVSFGTLS